MLLLLTNGLQSSVGQPPPADMDDATYVLLAVLVHPLTDSKNHYDEQQNTQ